ncbi:hypothetical protein [Streptomyces sp. VRA16 Mangrove soil]|uniref:hypothetical protein n=1 Tax=Streptomyces sp. VRA16 Mangrove soil TaxID=2817434 RepID=UPI001A9F0A59|nr:hypothetical protein [Streptomyces sp. VRA16 Mangrove soil]MBO1332244.1 hypothetical protein [Streptomyces sp. VRA16 Mangrove soil]
MYLHELLDSDPVTWDLDALPPLHDTDEEDFGLPVAVADDPAGALGAAAGRTAAVPRRWANQGMAGDEYRDFVVAGRPADGP